MTPAFPSFREALRVWLRIGLLSFGGPAGQIALLHREVVEERRWVGERRFLHGLNLCTLLPGPEAMQLATLLGWHLHGVRGGLAAGLLFVLPGAAVMLALTLAYALLGEVPLVAALFLGLKCAVLVLVVQALIRIVRRALRGTAAWVLAGLAFLALFVLGAPFPLVVLSAGLVGLALPDAVTPAAHGAAAGQALALLDALLAADPGRPARMAPGARRAGWIAVFFSQMAVVTFGGAYAVLAYVAQEAVQDHRWLTADEMLTGLGLAETTPGPLILVLQFVGFLAGHRAPGALTGLPGGLVGAALTLWVTFLPSFAFIFLLGPSAERWQGNRALAGALAAVTAAVVGVIANLALWFGLRVLFREHRPLALALEVPVPVSLDPAAAGLSALAAILLFGLRWGVVPALAVTAAAGAALRLLGAA